MYNNDYGVHWVGGWGGGGDPNKTKCSASGSNFTMINCDFFEITNMHFLAVPYPYHLNGGQGPGVLIHSVESSNLLQ